MAEKTQTERTTVPQGRHLHLLADRDVQRWYQNLKRSSEITADVRLRRLGSFCEKFHTAPQNLIQKDPQTITDILDDAVAVMEAEGYSPGYIKSNLVAVKSWLDHFGLKPTRRIKIRNADVPVTLADEKVPEREELTEMLVLGSLKARAIKQVMAKTGVRPQVIGNYRGTDGLRLKDLPELAITSTGATFLSYPPMMIVRPELSKTKQQYFTFLTTSAATTLLTYLNKRIQSGEKLHPDSPLIPTHSSKRPFLTSALVSREVRKSLRPRFTQRPYVFRSFFDTQLLVAEAKGKIPHDFRVFWMGHKGSIEARYTTNKHRLPESLIKEMKAAFKRPEQFLDLERFQEDEAEKQRQQIQARVAELEPEALGQILELISKISGNTARSK